MPRSHTNTRLATSTSSTAHAPVKWWQWLLVYPALLIALLPPAIELVKSSVAKVPYGKSSDGEQQIALWTKNIRCIEAPFDGVVNEFNVQTDATICKSGDVLVRFIGPNDKKAYRWVAVERFDQRSAATFSLVSSAMAQPSPSFDQEVTLCQWSRSDGWIIRRVMRRAQGICFNEHVWAATGEVKHRQPVDCRAPCR